jgi:hypothetical protein
MNIPQTVHQIWLGPRPIPEHFLPWMRSIEIFAPGWTYRLWRDSDLSEILPRALLPDVLSDVNLNLGLRADVLRYEILRQQGGVYFDCDFELLRPLHHLLIPGCLHYGDELSGRPAIGFLAAPPGFELWGLLLRRIRRGLSRGFARWQDIVALSGPEAFAAALNIWVGEWIGTAVRDEAGQPVAVHYAAADVAAFWREVLYPYWYTAHSWREFSTARYPQARAAHHWGGSWQAGAPDSTGKLRVSICTVVRNRAANLQRLVESLVASGAGWPGEIELIIADFRSEDTDWAFMESLPFPARRLEVPGLFSMGRGRNTAIRAATGEVLVVLDADMLLPPGFLRDMIPAAMQPQALFPIYEREVEPGGRRIRGHGWGNIIVQKQLLEGLTWPEQETWGGEDTVMAAQLRRRVAVWRQPVPGFIHQWHARNPDEPTWNRTARDDP